MSPLGICCAQGLDHGEVAGECTQGECSATPRACAVLSVQRLSLVLFSRRQVRSIVGALEMGDVCV